MDHPSGFVEDLQGQVGEKGNGVSQDLPVAEVEILKAKAHERVPLMLVPCCLPEGLVLKIQPYPVRVIRNGKRDFFGMLENTALVRPEIPTEARALAKEMGRPKAKQ
ncbi:MAG: hypothetical protein IPG32_01400 [Saprospirales bacterium]|nr:hypothetical protein [Saprospirales bacterium]